MIKLEDVFKSHREIEEILSEEKLSKDTYGYIGSALKNCCNHHVSVVLGCQKWVACIMPLDSPSDLFREHNG